MAYEHIVAAANDQDLLLRIAAAAASEGFDGDQFAWANDNKWEFAAEPGWGAAYASAASIPVERPGLRDSVVSDGMILTAVQAKLP